MLAKINWKKFFSYLFIALGWFCAIFDSRLCRMGARRHCSRQAPCLYRFCFDDNFNDLSIFPIDSLILLKRKGINMAIRLPKAKDVKVIESIKAYFDKNMETEMGDLNGLMIGSDQVK